MHALGLAEVKALVGPILFISPAPAKAVPETTVTAQYSLPYCRAVALCFGEDGPMAFSEEAIGDSETLALAARVRTEFICDLAQRVLAGQVRIIPKNDQSLAKAASAPRGIRRTS